MQFVGEEGIEDSGQKAAEHIDGQGRVRQFPGAAAQKRKIHQVTERTADGSGSGDQEKQFE